jgi:hypothetical protein
MKHYKTPDSNFPPSLVDRNPLDPADAWAVGQEEGGNMHLAQPGYVMEEDLVEEDNTVLDFDLAGQLSRQPYSVYSSVRVSVVVEEETAAVNQVYYTDLAGRKDLPVLVLVWT